MDGWGIGTVPKADAIAAANTPFVHNCYSMYPHSTLVTCGTQVGLPAGQMGNSEVGHLNLGAGRIVYQELERINVAIANGSYFQNETLLTALYNAKTKQVTVHIMGLLSDGGVHSHINHLKATLTLCHSLGITNVLVHAFTDGRDTDPKSGIKYITALTEHMHNTVGTLATVTGRYYAMDRDKRWERVAIAYNALVHGVGEPSSNIIESMQQHYNNGITDEFITPIINTNLNALTSHIKDGDVVFNFNFRTDRCREITEVLTQHNMPDYNMHTLNIDYVTMTEYDKNYNNVAQVFTKDNLTNTLGEVIAANGLTQIRIAETEKYPHVSFFFSGGRELAFKGESRILAPSPKVATYDLAPQMSAHAIADSITVELNHKSADFICLNFANADMVGHTGVFNAVIQAVETVDTCVAQIVTAALHNNYTVLLTADHGNAEYMINDDGTPNTAHTTNPVPYFIIDNTWKPILKPGKLADVAPTILSIMGLPIPNEMTGEVLYS